MARIAFILLCHKDPEGVIAQVGRLTAAGDHVAIHFDASASAADFARIRTALAGNPSVAFAAKRHRCGWGEWSLVAATLSAVQAGLAAFPDATHFYMLSGDCMPIKSAAFVRDFLDREDADYIESFDFYRSGWIKTGIREERLIYRHWFNERRRKWWFYTSLDWQRRLGLARRVPEDLSMQIGSQWWCLRRATVQAVLRFCRERPEVLRFFRTTWIPDETFFQTVVRHLVPDKTIRTRSLTFLAFTDYGMPVTFYNDHHDLLVRQDYLFARKISPDALDLKKRLGELYASDRRDFPMSNEGRRLFAFLSARGRVGRRFAERFWERETSIGRDRTLLIVICKKWHVAKRLADRVSAMTDIPAVHYLFEEGACPLPDLGGIESTLGKRTRHRRALVRLLYDHWQTDRLLLCMDPAGIELMRDFARDQATTRFLDIECEFNDDYLIGHAMRIGLLAANSPQALADQLLPTVRHDIRYEAERIRDAGLAGLHRIRESAPARENTLALASFLGMPAELVREIARTPHLFTD